MKAGRVNHRAMPHVMLYDESKTVYVNKKEVHIPWRSFLVLKKLMDANGKVVSRKEILSTVWKDWPRGINLETRTVDQHVSHLRNDYGIGKRIQTKAPWGYRWVPEA